MFSFCHSSYYLLFLGFFPLFPFVVRGGVIATVGFFDVGEGPTFFVFLFVVGEGVLSSSVTSLIVRLIVLLFTILINETVFSDFKP